MTGTDSGAHDAARPDGDARPMAASIVIPIGRVDPDLEPQLRAVAAQQGIDPFEVVLSLNSPDAEERRKLDAVVARLADARFRIVTSSDKRGAAHARNVGAREALADVLAFCDADDIVEPDWLANIVAGLDTYDAVSGHLEEEMLMPAGQHHWRPATTPDSLPMFLDVPYLLSGNTAIKRAVFEKVAGFDESLHRCEDIAIGFALQKQGFTIGYAPTATIHYRHRASLKGLVVQHYHYGKGMSQVLVRYGLPRRDHADGQQPSGMGLLKPNRNPGGGFSMVRVLRRTGTLAGRLVGLVQERARGTVRV